MELLITILIISFLIFYLAPLFASAANKWVLISYFAIMVSAFISMWGYHYYELYQPDYRANEGNGLGAAFGLLIAYAITGMFIICSLLASLTIFLFRKYERSNV